MRVVVFCPSLASRGFPGNAPFLRGVVRELRGRGHAVATWSPLGDPADASAPGEGAPGPDVGAPLARLALGDGAHRYDPVTLAAHAPVDGLAPDAPTSTAGPLAAGTPIDGWLDAALDGADLVLVHERTDPALVRRLGTRRALGASWRLLYHDAHHRAVAAHAATTPHDLAHYDGVLAGGDAVREPYRRAGWGARAWTWHAAADHRLFQPGAAVTAADTAAHTAAARDGADARTGALLWIGDWGEGARARELGEFLVEPVRALGLAGRAYGRPLPDAVRAELGAAGIAHAGWLSDERAPAAYAGAAVTVHVPHGPRVHALPGVPSRRLFEALACGVPLVSAPWHDSEGLFTPGDDFLVAADGAAMRRHLRDVQADAELARTLAERGRRTILARHTCGHRVDQLLGITTLLGLDPTVPRRAVAGAVG